MIGDDRFLGPVDILLGTRIKKNLIVTLCFGLIDCWWDKSHACLNKKQQLSKNSTITQATFLLLGGSRNSGGVSSKISLSQPFFAGKLPHKTLPSTVAAVESLERADAPTLAPLGVVPRRFPRLGAETATEESPSWILIPILSCCWMVLVQKSQGQLPVGWCIKPSKLMGFQRIPTSTG